MSSLVTWVALPSRAPSSQLDLFTSPIRGAPPPPDPDFARKNLHRLLRQVQRAERLPWHPAQARVWEDLFPQLAQALPPEEGQDLCAAFAAELARLRA